MTNLPTVAHALETWRAVDDVTSAEEIMTQVHWMVTPETGKTEDGVPVLGWVEGEMIIERELSGKVTEDGLHWLATDVNGHTFRIRDLDPYDAVTLAPGAGVPQPVAVIRAAFDGGMMANELDAVVAADNTVVTLMLDTSLGVFVRYGHAWEKLSEDSESLADHSLISVAPTALAVFDAAYAANVAISISDLPTKHNKGDGTTMLQLPNAVVEAETLGPDNEETLAAAGTPIPMIASAADLATAIRFGTSHPDARWYISKRAHALDAGDQIPGDWFYNPVAPAALTEA